jgi:hypothetical protein
LVQKTIKHTGRSALIKKSGANGRDQINWGGAFETKAGSGTPDLMHFDLSGVRGRYGHNLITNLTPIPNVKYGQAPAPQKSKTAELHGSPL